jgi:hypothetical protein
LCCRQAYTAGFWWQRLINHFKKSMWAGHGQVGGISVLDKKQWTLVIISTIFFFGILTKNWCGVIHGKLLLLNI